MASYVDELVRKKIQSIEEGGNVFELGKVRRVQSYILEVGGLESAAYFDHVTVNSPGHGRVAEGYVDRVGRDAITVALTQKYSRVVIGDEVVGSGKEFTMQFAPQAMGHVVDMFGRDLLAGERFAELRELPVESPNIPIMDRGTVSRPFHTGIVGIDLMYPVGRGQRQLIIGDKKTGKTQIALDAIVNQREEGVLCIYVAIGKTKKEIKEIYAELLRRGAMEYTIIMAAFNDECPPVLRNTPYAAMTVAQHYMLEEQKDVLVVIDDLKRHADVCREIALLSGKVPGRDAYPSEIFYSHASLLEQGCQHKNGGSITVLPICETKGGDITDYISTNIISITDGQIVLSAKSFEQGQKPAIHYGLSVSRLGGAVQTGGMKRTNAAMRRELLSYLETREVYELTNENEMSPELRERLRRGRTILDKLRQPKFSPRSESEIMEEFAPLMGKGSSH
ncbi:MAG: F0F1 ATP synthase subunit alpha [Clostridia bacterium]|nr:F0F1 ATP synthase subunit alpha [Clostridia bacterium]